MFPEEEKCYSMSMAFTEIEVKLLCFDGGYCHKDLRKCLDFCISMIINAKTALKKLSLK